MEEKPIDLPDYKEDWITILAHNGKFEASNHGRIRRKKSKRLLTLTEGSDGLLYVDMAGTTYRVDHVVSRAFLGLCPRGFRLWHCDGHLTNNSIHNLKYIPIVYKKKNEKKA